MTTKNIRTVTYLPPEYHQKLQKYAQKHNLTESAALFQMVKQFFEGSSESSPTLPSTELAAVLSEMAQLQQRLSIVEGIIANGSFVAGAAATSGRRRPSSAMASRHSSPQLPPQTAVALARRLGVNVGTVEEAAQKGNDYFKQWSQRKDPVKKVWEKRGELYHPLLE